MGQQKNLATEHKMTEANSLLRMEGIRKQFPGALANDNVALDIKKGEIHGLLGENGAGKTTLMNILYGLYEPDEGEIYLEGNQVEITNPHRATELGIGMVHQHFMLVENLTVLENVILGLDHSRKISLDLKNAREKFLRLAGEYQLDINPDAPVWQLSVGDRQWLEIIKLLFRNVRLLILDEPTTVLAPSQIIRLFNTMQKLVSEGCSIIFISHKLDEIKEITNRVTVMRDGSTVGTIPTKETTPTKLAGMMVGRDITLGRKSAGKPKIGNKVLEITNLNCLDDRGAPAINDLFLSLYSGEILGVAGINGNGQRELAECIAGLRKPHDGEIIIDGNPVNGDPPGPNVLGYMPEDKQERGLILDFTVGQNFVIKNIQTKLFTRTGVINWNKIYQYADNLITKYNIKTPNAHVPVATLSGGNQQKVVVAREVSGTPPVLLCCQPTRGLDIASVEALHDLLLSERSRGTGIIFISTELNEVISISDRIVVMFHGSIMGEVSGEEANVTTIGQMMLGKKIEEIEGE